MALPAKETAQPLERHHWRVVVAAPPAGFSGQLSVMHGWLDAACGPAGWTSMPAGTGGVVNDAVAFYFTDPDIARAFVTRFVCGYRTVSRPTL